MFVFTTLVSAGREGGGSTAARHLHDDQTLGVAPLLEDGDSRVLRCSGFSGAHCTVMCCHTGMLSQDPGRRCDYVTSDELLGNLVV